MDQETVDNITNAVTNGRTDIVRTLLTVCEKGDGQIEGFNSNLQPETLLNSLFCEQGSLLHLATKLDHADIVRTLLSAGAEPNLRNSSGETAYSLAATEMMKSVYIEELLKCSAKSNIPRINQLIDSGICVDGYDSPFSGNTALHWAASYGNVDAVQCLLDHGASINITNSDGATPLHDAVSRKDLDVTRKLLLAGADPLTKSVDGVYKNKTPLDLATEDKELEELVQSFLPNPETSTKTLNGSCSHTSSSMESLRIENGFVESVSHLSIASSDEIPKKQNLSSYVSQSLTLPPFSIMSSPPPLITDAKLHLLWPLPLQIIQNDGPHFRLLDSYSVYIVQSCDNVSNQDVLSLWETHNETSLIPCIISDILSSWVAPSGPVICHVNEHLFDKKQCYKIVVSSEQIRLFASDLAGLHYCICTFFQLLKLYQSENSIPPLYIEDSPVMQNRGILLDMSVGARKPTLKTLRGQIRMFSLLKLNQIFFYYKLQPKSDALGPYNHINFISILEYCRRWCLVPIPAIDVAAEVTFEELKDFASRIHNLMSLFSSNQVHLGPNMSTLVLKAAFDMGASTAMNLLSLPSRSMIYFTINGVSIDSKFLHTFPLNVVFVEYGYQAEHDYDRSMKNIICTGLPVIVGVGTSSWGSISGCPETATNNIYKASQSAAFNGALGMVIADWKTTPHHPALCFSLPGIVLMAGLSWNNSIHLDFLHTRLPELLNHFIVQNDDQILGYIIVELGRLEAFVHRIAHIQKIYPLEPVASSSVLHQFTLNPDSILMDNFTNDLLLQAVRHLKKFELDLKKAKPKCFQEGEIVAELQVAIEMQLFSCRLAKVMMANGTNPHPSAGFTNITNVGAANLPPIAKTDLANRLLGIVEQFRAVWLSRNVPCGLHESLYLFNSLLNKLVPDSEQFFSSADGFVRQ